MDDYEKEIIKFAFGFNPSSTGFNLRKKSSLEDQSSRSRKEEFVENLPTLNLKKHCSESISPSEEKIQSPQLFEASRKIFPFYSPDLIDSNRKLVISWLIEVHKKLKMRYETLYLTIFLMDKYCQNAHVSKKNYQLLASTCLFIAGKYEEVTTPKIHKIVSLSDGLFTFKDVLRMESLVFVEMNFFISQPSVNWFVGTFLNVIKRDVIRDNFERSTIFLQYEKCCYSLLELSLFHW